MGVKAHCTNCQDKHDLGDRQISAGTTTCPECGSKSYRSEPVITEGTTSTTEHLDPDALSEISGVGETVSKSIERKYSTVESLQQAGVEDLCTIDHIGPTVAQRVLDATS